MNYEGKKGHHEYNSSSLCLFTIMNYYMAEWPFAFKGFRYTEMTTIGFTANILYSIFGIRLSSQFRLNLKN